MADKFSIPEYVDVSTPEGMQYWFGYLIAVVHAIQERQTAQNGAVFDILDRLRDVEAHLDNMPCAEREIYFKRLVELERKFDVEELLEDATKDKATKKKEMRREFVLRVGIVIATAIITYIFAHINMLV